MKNHPILKIIIKNTFTLFNFVNLVLALMVAFVGSFKNMLFIFIAIANTLISIINEVRAYKIVEKMRLRAEQRPTVIRDDKSFQIPPEEVKKGDQIVLALGDQILYDSIMQDGTLEVNEAFITGEQDNIEKHPGDELISGSFVVAGSATAKVTAVGEDNSLAKIESAAHNLKTADSKLFLLMNKIVKYISYALIPVGALLLWSRFRTESDTTTAITSTVAALINMIPEGLILLTSSVLALATIRLSKKKVLVQDLYATETLARVDTFALDKTGTLTTGHMTVHDYTAYDNTFEGALQAILAHQMSENDTVTALKQKFVRGAKFKPTGDFAKITETIPFSSERKYSGIKTKTATYLMGAIDFLTSDQSLIDQVKSASGDYRVITVIKRTSGDISEGPVGGYDRDRRSASPVTTEQRSEGIPNLFGIPSEAVPSPQTGASDSVPEEVSPDVLLGIVRLEDEIRPTAKHIIDYFYNNDIAPVVISGDDLDSVAAIVKKVGMRDPKGVNLSSLKTKNYATLVKNYNVFTRVKPSEKQQLIKALRKRGRTVAMTGDGVNDILAMKEADASLAIGEGSDAARRAAKFVLMGSNFDTIPAIIDEGRQSINNLERSTTLFLAKTVYATILAVIFVILPFSYPFSPIEMSLLSFACIGLPGLILALEPNTERIKNQFTRNIIEYSIPIGFTVSVAMLALSIVSHYNNFSRFELTTTSVFITFTIDLMLIYWISRPLNKLRTALLLAIIAIMAGAFLIPFAREFFEFTFLAPNGLLIMFIIIAVSIAIFFLLKHFASRLSTKILSRLRI